MTTDTSYQSTKKLPAGSTGDFTATVYDEDGSALAGSSVDSWTLSLKTESGATINSREGTTNPAANVTISEAGLLTWEIQPEDTAIQDTGNVQVGQIENHIAIFTWLYDSSAKKGIHKLTLECVRLS